MSLSERALEQVIPSEGTFMFLANSSSTEVLTDAIVIASVSAVWAYIFLLCANRQSTLATPVFGSKHNILHGFARRIKIIFFFASPSPNLKKGYI
jgi:hypothetical protein